MESNVIFRDRQELQSADLNNAQEFARDAIDHVVKDAIEPGNGYTGFAATKTSATEITLSPGRLYGAGAVFARNEATVLDLFNQLPLVTRKRVAVVAWGQEVDTDVQPRDFLINAQNGQTEPQSVAMERARRSELSVVAGVESPDPSYPPTDANVTVIAYVLLDTNGVVSIEQWQPTRVRSLRDLSNRTQALELWRGNISGQVDTLRTDLSALADRMKDFAHKNEIIDLTGQLEELRQQVFKPASYMYYGTNHFLDTRDTNEAFPGYDAVVDEGIRFPMANEASKALALLNPTNVFVTNANGFILPKHSHGMRMDLTGYSSEQRIAAFTYQTTEIRQLSRTRQRRRYGSSKTVCTNSAWWRSGQYDTESRVFRIGNETWQVMDVDRFFFGLITRIRLVQFWVDSYEEPYWEQVTNTASISGAQVAQTFLNSQDGWLSQIGLYFSRLAASGDVNVLVCETSFGMPDLQRVISRTTVPYNQLKSGSVSGGAGLPSLVESQIPIQPTYMKAGRRYAIVVITAADHYLAMTNSDNGTVQGTFFQSTDGAFFAGNLIDDMKMRLYFAKFERTRVAIDLEPLQLAGGILSVDFLNEAIEPPATRIDYELQINGAWVPLAPFPNGPDLTSLPAIIPLRAVLTGTTDLMPGIGLATSQVTVSRPKTALKWASDERSMGSSTTSIKVQLDLEFFDEAKHDVTITLRTGATLATVETADAVSNFTLSSGAIRRTATFNIPAATKYAVVIDGAAVSAADLFHVAEMVEYAQA